MPLTIVKHSPANHPSGLLLCRHTPKRARAWSSAMVVRPEMAPGRREYSETSPWPAQETPCLGTRRPQNKGATGAEKPACNFSLYINRMKGFFFVPLSLREKDSRPVCRWPTRASRKGERKVRAAQGIPLPNRKRLARACRCRRKQPPCLGKVRVRRWGKSPPGQW